MSPPTSLPLLTFSTLKGFHGLHTRRICHAMLGSGILRNKTTCESPMLYIGCQTQLLWFFGFLLRTLVFHRNSIDASLLPIVTKAHPPYTIITCANITRLSFMIVSHTSQSEPRAFAISMTSLRTSKPQLYHNGYSSHQTWSMTVTIPPLTIQVHG